MDFGTLLHMAKKNSEENKNDAKYYSTKFAPPKKISKEKKLSDNIQKFLAKREQEEKAKQREQKEKLDNLLALRDDKSKNKIRKMLKVTKSANKSVLDDAVNMDHTALTMSGPEQPDQDDYGYVSTEANSFYQKYIEKVKDVKEDKGFAPSRPQSLKDLSGTKERVKAAITREIEEKNSHTRSRTHTSTSTSTAPSSSAKGTRTSSSSSKNLYDPEAERRAEEDERKKREDEERKARMKNRKPAPPVMDFQALLKLAEKKQHEPIALPVVNQKKKEPERLLTFKEKQEYEERQRAREAKERREKERQADAKKKSRDSKNDPSSSGSTQRMEPNGRIPRLNQAAGTSNGSSNGSKSSSSNGADKKTISSHEFKKPLSSPSMPAAKTSSSFSSSSSKTSSASLANSKSSSKPSSSSSSSNNKNSSSNIVASKNPYGNSKNKQASEGPTRQFPPRDVKSTKTREFPPSDIGKTRQFPPSDVRRGPPQQGSSKYSDNRKSTAPKRRILDEYEDDSEYDSELDDFIDDEGCEEDISSHIKAIFGYDKSKYKHLDDADDRCMESSFAQVQREEFISKKIGIQEDLDDMKMEAIMKKRKIAKRRRLLEED